MTAPGGYDAIVLAGGRSRRMDGVDKIGLVVDGSTLLAHACAAVDGAEQVVVVGPPSLAGLPAGVDRVQEDPPFAGPAAAIGAGLEALGSAPASAVVVLAADVPRGGEAIATLLAVLAESPAADGVVARDAEGQRQPLLAVYRVRALSRAVAAAGSLTGLSVRALISTLDLVGIDLPDRVTADIDTLDDLRCFSEDRTPHSHLGPTVRRVLPAPDSTTTADETRAP